MLNSLTSLPNWLPGRREITGTRDTDCVLLFPSLGCLVLWCKKKWQQGVLAIGTRRRETVSMDAATQWALRCFRPLRRCRGQSTSSSLNATIAAAHSTGNGRAWTPASPLPISLSSRPNDGNKSPDIDHNDIVSLSQRTVRSEKNTHERFVLHCELFFLNYSEWLILS